MKRCAVALILLAPLLGAAPETTPTTEPNAPDLNPRQQNLLLQLSDAEANIQATNKALVQTGYKVGLAYHQIDSNVKANELMDRNGGGPVRWDQFYGRTAQDFYHSGSVDVRYNGGHGYTTLDAHATGSRLTAINRPRQFDYIYRANDDQMKQAQQQISSLLQNQNALLARRQKHEADQSRLWATIAFEQVRDRDISDEPLCRFQLKGATGHSTAEEQAIRAAVLFLRMANSLANDDVGQLDSNQSRVFADIATRMKSAFGALQTSLADSLLASDVTPDDVSRVGQLKAVCKRLFEECTVVADNYRNALDRDEAKEDNSKLQFRGALQESLSAFAADVAELDAQIADTAKAWNVQPQKGVAAADVEPGGKGSAAPAAKVDVPATPTGASLEKPAADDKDSATFVRFDRGETELGILKDGSASFSNREYQFHHLPAEMAGKTFTRRAGGKPTDLQIDPAAGATIYLMVNSDIGFKGMAKLNAQLASSGWVRLSDSDYGGKNALAVYKQTFSSRQHVALSGAAFAGFIVASDNLKLAADDSQHANPTS